MSRYVVAALLVCTLLAVAAGGCSSGPPPQQAAQPGTGTQQQPAAGAPVPGQGQGAGSWPEWSGPRTLGPGKPLPEQWCVELTHIYKPGYGYRIRVTSAGEWSDETPRKGGDRGEGTLTAEELQAVRESLAAIDWDLVPEASTKDYVAYTSTAKTPAGPQGDFVGYHIAYWGGQTHASPWYRAKWIYVDFKVGCAPEAARVIEAFKPLLEKYIPPE